MPDLSTVVNMFFGADNNKVLYALIILVTLDYITGVNNVIFQRIVIVNDNLLFKIEV